MPRLHMTLGDKGGIGKSFIAVLLAQYLLDNVTDVNLTCLDLDPKNTTGVVMPKDDPALLFAGTVNIMLEDMTASIAAALDKYQNEHEGIARRWRHDAEASAAKILNAALDAGREAMANALNEGAAKVLAVVWEESLAALLHQRMELDAAMTGIRRHTSFMLLASGAVLVAAILALFI